ncbi:hypothetical protein MKQ70_10675 [Chitinophaga sedimenti]|uniref:hypothetical protein n=1 Tax=Chitinophaga sedimenti TaxID=2033606 RepID=UPI0020042859|nr:hypothetical protein [Chitinophaga sedimenti]MCK7555444.1 hypothetical protein [Chitinophaga sedimenti]
MKRHPLVVVFLVLISPACFRGSSMLDRGYAQLYIGYRQAAFEGKDSSHTYYFQIDTLEENIHYKGRLIIDNTDTLRVFGSYKRVYYPSGIYKRKDWRYMDIHTWASRYHAPERIQLRLVDAHKVMHEAVLYRRGRKL